MKTEMPSSCPKCGAAVPAEAPHGLCPKCVLEGAAAFPDESSNRRGRSAAPSVEAIAAAFPELEVTELIGTGGMGSVYKARQAKLDRLVALKILSLDLAEDPAFAERFNREARMLGLLNHANIVSVYDFGQQADFYYLMMEYVDGVNLRQAMQAGSFSPPEALAIVPDICAALQFAHDEGVMHRDIKPENILIDTRGRVKIADFGVAKLMGEKQEPLNLTVSGTVMGTPHYMAPEQLENSGEVDHRADIYSLGVVFYEMLTGELPIGRFESPSERVPMDARVDDIVLRTLEKQREKRFQNAGEIKTEVEHVTQTPAGTQAIPQAQQSDSQDAGTARWVTWSAALTMASFFLVVPWSLIFLGMRVGSTPNRPEGMMTFVFLFAILAAPAISGLTGFFLGWSALREIHDSNGTRKGLTRALFGTLAWPLLVAMGLTGLLATAGMGVILGAIAMFLVGEVILITVWRWAKCLPHADRAEPFWTRGQTTMAILAGIFLLIATLLLSVPIASTVVYGWTEQAATAEWTEPPPEIQPSISDDPAINFELTVPAGRIATLSLLKVEAGQTNWNQALNGFVIAADSQPWTGQVLLGQKSEIRPDGLPAWEFRLKGPNREHGVSAGLPADWVIGASDLPQMNLVVSKSQLFKLTPKNAATTNGAVWLQIVSRLRTGPDIPNYKLSEPILDAASTNWVEKLEQHANRPARP